MTDYALAEAFVQIRPDTTGFRAEAEAKIKSALTGLNPEVKIKLTPDISGFTAALKTAVARALGGAKAAAITVPLKVVADEGSVNDALRLLKQRMAQVGVVDFLDYNLPIGKIQFQIQLLKRMIEQANLADFLAVNLKPGQTLAGAANLRQDVQRELSNVSLGVSLSAADLSAEAIAARAAAAAGIGKITIPVTEQLTGTIGAIPLPRQGGGDTQAQAAAAAAALLNLAASETNAASAAKLMYAANLANNIALDDTKTKADAAGGGIGILNGLIVAGGNGWGALTGKIKLFGGALGAIPILGIASYWHILTDLIIETGTELLGATIGIAAFGAVAAPTAQHIGVQFQNIWTAANALNQAIYPLTKSMQNLDAAVRPEVYTLLGEGLVVATAKAGEFAKVAAAVGQVLDQLGARAAAALVSGGFSTFLEKAPVDVAQIGTIIGNIFGIIGNFLKVLPGYAQILFGVLANVTGALEAVSASPITEFIIRWGLAFHGAILYIGLAVTAFAILGNALLALGAKFGLASASAQFFNATLFLNGVRQAVGGVGLLAGEMITLGSGEDIAAAGALALEGAMAALQALAPVLIVTAIAAAVYGLVKAFTDATNATADYDAGVKAALANTPVSQLSISLVHEMASTTAMLAAAQDTLNSTTENTTVYMGRSGVAVKGVSTAFADQAGVVAGYRAELANLQTYQQNYNTLLKAAGGNLQFVNLAGITSNDIMDASKGKMAQLTVEVQAQVDQWKAMALGTGRAGAAMNALNYTGDTTNNMLGSLDVDMQKIITGQDDLNNVILGGEQSFIGFDQAIRTWGTDLGKSGGYLNSLTGETANALTQQSDFYNTVVPAAQKLTDALELQLAPTSQITAAVATEAKYMLSLAGTNKTMQAVIISMINNAIGPGTVGFQNLNKWVSANSTTQQGFQAIVASSTVNAAKLGGTINSLTQSMFDNDLLMSAHVTPDLKAYTTAIVDNNDNINAPAVVAGRAKLIQDYKNAGLSAQAATTLVDGLTTGFRNNGNAILTTNGNMTTLQRTIDGMHGKTVTVDVAASASGGVHITSNAPGAQPYSIFFHARGGGKVPGSGSGDIIPALLEPGEVVVDKGTAMRLAPLFRAMGVRGFQGGGLVTSIPPVTGLASGDAGIDSALATKSDSYAAASSLMNFIQGLFNFHGGGGAGVAPPTSGTVAGWLTVALRDTGGPLSWLPALEWLTQQESGGNPYAIDPIPVNGEHATGLLQTLPSTYAEFATVPGGIFNPISNAVAAIRYIMSTYGSPLNIPGIFVHDYGYDNGGWLPPGHTLAYNGTGQPEMVLPAPSTRKSVPVASPGSKIVIQMASSGDAGFDAFMTSWLCKAAVTRGGGSVQVAFGTGNGAYS